VVDVAKAGKALEKFGNDVAYPPEQRAADMEAIAKSRQVLGAATAEKIVATLALFTKGDATKDDILRARTLAGMALVYANMASQAKETDELATMKMALVSYADTRNQEAADRFGDAATRLAFTGDIGKLKTTASTWSAGACRSVAQDALAKTEELVGQKKYDEAGSLLTYTAMYADSVATLGLTKPKPPAPLSQEAVTSTGTMARALSAIERGQAQVDGQDAGEVFMENYEATLRSGQKMVLLQHYSRLGQLFEGKVPLSKDSAPDLVPKLREYERSSTLTGQTLDQLFAACGRAARSGDQDAYDRSVMAFGKRFSLVNEQYSRGQVAEGMDQMNKAIHSIFLSYSGGVPADATSRLRKLRDGMTEFSAMLRSGEELDKTIPKLRYEALSGAFKREQALAMIAKQAQMNESYIAMTKNSPAAISLRESGGHLKLARDALLNGNDKKAREEYEEAMSGREDALAMFSALGKGKRMGGGATELFDPWLDAHISIFNGVLAGRDTTELQKAAGLVELSVFALPENAR
jgi:hypothetical protein